MKELRTLNPHPYPLPQAGEGDFAWIVNIAICPETDLFRDWLNYQLNEATSRAGI